jgi:hypothetical protein
LKMSTKPKMKFTMGSEEAAKKPPRLSAIERKII